MRVRTDHILTVDSYFAAKSRWQQGKPWRGDTGVYAPRDLGHRRKKHMSVRLGNNDQYIFRLYDTDVVTYFPDGTVKLVGYDSASTRAFANALTPRGVSCAFPFVGLLNKDGERMAYRCKNNEMTLRPTGDNSPTAAASGVCAMPLFEPVGETKPFIKATLNRQRAKETLERFKFDEFAAWLKASIAMGRKFVGGQSHASDIPWLLKLGPEEWPTIVNGFHSVEKNLDHVRLSLYRMENCVDVTEVPTVGWYQVNNVLRQGVKYGVFQ